MPTVDLAEVYERTNRKGQRYLVGRVGRAKLLIVPTGRISRGEPVWRVILGEGPYSARDDVGAQFVEAETSAP